jgi:tRNA(fMet)-specific endonuclease VapC
VGTVLDTTVFVELERSARAGPASQAIEAFYEHLSSTLGEEEDVGVAAITTSELLHGVHRAGSDHRVRREAFVETVLATFPVLPFDLLVSRVHARLWASLAAAGADVGAHDRIVAATAMAAGWRVATANTRHFKPIAGLDVVEV